MNVSLLGLREVRHRPLPGLGFVVISFSFFFPTGFKSFLGKLGSVLVGSVRQALEVLVLSSLSPFGCRKIHKQDLELPILG